jgi:hypothetical protein
VRYNAGDNVAGQIAVAGAPLTVTYTNVNDGFAYFEATGNLAPGTYLVFVTYKGVTVDHLVTVNTTPDNVAPVATACADDMTVYNLTNGSCEANVTVTVPTFVDNCDGPLVPVGVRGDGMALTDPYPVGVTTITWTATDAAGNVGICYSNVIVEDQEAPQIQQLPNITVNLSAVNPTGCSANVTWTEPVVADCSNFSVVSTDSSGDLFSQGVSTVTYTATDEYGNSSQMSFTVTVVDNVPPTVSCQAAPFVIPSICDNVPLPDFTPLVTASDNCQGPLTYTQNPPAGTDMVDVFGAGNLFNGATTTVVMTVTDAAGNAASCSVTIVLQDMGMPVPAIATLGDITPQTTPGASCGSLIVEAPVAFNCQGGIIYGTPSFSNGMVAGSNPPAYVFNAGTFSSGLQITWTYTNQNGLSATQAQFIQIINDVVDPMINVAFPGFVSGNINLGTSDDGLGNCDVNPADAGRNWTVTANTNAHVLPLTMPAVAGDTVDNCGVVELWFTVQFPDGSDYTSTSSAVSVNPADVDYPLGVSTVTVYAEDAAGNVGSSGFTVTVADDEAPVITCVGNQIVIGNGTTCAQAIVLNSGSTVVSGNTTGNPLASVPSCGTSLSTAPAVWYALQNFTGPVTISTCGTASWDTKLGVFSGVSCAGLTCVTGNDDACGLQSQVFFIADPSLTYFVLVTGFASANGPYTLTITAPQTSTTPPGSGADMVVNTDPGVCTYTHSGTAWDATATDNCSVASIGYVLTGATTGSGTTLDGVAFNLGVTTVTWTATDGSGNTDVCSFTVTVNDNQNPLISCVSSQTVPTDPGVCEYTHVGTAWDATATDNCSVAGITYTSSGAGVTPATGTSLNGAVFAFGATTITWTATDGSGNTASCSFVVTVVDNEPPHVTSTANAFADIQGYSCGQAIVIPAGVNSCETFRTVAIPQWADNCTAIASTTYSADNGVNLTNFFDSFVGGNFPVGITTITFTATDFNGNTGVCSITIEVEDLQAPTVTGCPTNQTVNTDPGMCTAVVNLTIPSATDNCGVTSIVYSTTGATTLSGNGFPNALTFNQGVTNVTYLISDAAGNTVSCNFSITVIDNEAPVISCSNITQPADAGMCSAVVALGVTVTDNCTASPTLTGVRSDGLAINAPFPVGTTTVTWNATDAAGNVAATCTQTVTITDDQAPAIAGLPANISVNNTPGQCGAVVSWTAPTATDNCPGATIAQTAGPAGGSQFPVGTTTVTYTATDASGNTSTASFTVTVTDNEAPVASCLQAITISLDANGVAQLPVGDVNLASSDNCGIASIVLSQNTFSCADLGLNTVTMTVTDVNGNSSTCTIAVTVVDTIAPVAQCIAGITLSLDANGTATLAPADVDNGSSDNCNVTLSLSQTAFTCADLGTNTVTLTATDSSGNSSTCTVAVTVIDEIAPIVVCNNFTLELGPDGTAILDPAMIGGNSTDNCGITITAVSIDQFDCGDIGAPILVTYFATDASGNSASCDAFVTVVDNLAPVVVCPEDMLVDTDPGSITYTVPDFFANGMATATDNCTVPVTIFSQTPAPGTLLLDGTYIFTFTATDASGNVGQCSSFELTVQSTLGVSVGPDYSTLTMYPNPASSQVTIGNPNMLMIDTVSIYDINGRLVRAVRANATNDVSVDVSDLSSSVYMVIITGEDGASTVKRLIKK